MTMITPSYLGETIEYSSLHACRSTLEDPTVSLGLVKHLMVNDLKNLSANKDVSETIRKIATKMFRQKLDSSKKNTD